MPVYDSLLLIKTSVLHRCTPRDSPRPNLSLILYHFFFTAQCLFSLMPILEINLKITIIDESILFVLQKLTGTGPKEKECYQDDFTFN